MTKTLRLIWKLSILALLTSVALASVIVIPLELARLGCLRHIRLPVLQALPALLDLVEQFLP